MSKLHRISETYFQMDENGTIWCRYGMSIICKVKTGWGREGDPVEFYYRGQKLNGPETRVGDIVYMHHDGPRTSWIIGRKPRDPRLALLWEFGYRSATRIKVADPWPAHVVNELRTKAFGAVWTDGPNGIHRWAWNEYGAFIGDGTSSPIIVKDGEGKVLVALYSGRKWSSDHTYCNWYMADDARLIDVKSALISDRTWNKEHPLLQ